jgi:AP-3 complex subunit mu
MACIEAVYIIDVNGRTILDYPVSSYPAPLHSLVPLVVEHDQPRDVPPMIEISSSRMLFHQKHGNVIFLVPCSSTMPAFVPFEFIGRFAEALEKYFSPPIIPMKIEANLDTVTLILNEMLDDGFPHITEPDALKDLVAYEGILSKFLSGSKTTPSLSSMPWRRANVRHTNNELFVDIVETLYVIVPRTVRRKTASDISYHSSKPLVSRVEGAIFIISHLSGVPDIQLILNTLNHKLECPSFHQCVRLPRWKQTPGLLSFIPPDGQHLLASYTLENVGHGIVFADLRTGLGVNSDEFEARVWTVMAKDVKAVEGLKIDIVCDPSKAKNVKGLRITAGDFHFSGGTGEWAFAGKTPLGWNASLRGSLQPIADLPEDDSEEQERTEPVFPLHLSMTYTLTGQVPSGIRVQSLRIVSSRGLGEGVKPFKGVRFVTKVGEYVVR